MNKIEHIGIAVKDLGKSCSLYEKLLNTSVYKIEEVESENVRTAFFKVGDNKVELLGSTSPDGVIAKYVNARGEGIHHVAFLVDDILEEMQRLADEGFTLLSDRPRKGADNKMVCFVHPKDANGVLIELVQEIKWV